MAHDHWWWESGWASHSIFLVRELYFDMLSFSYTFWKDGTEQSDDMKEEALIGIIFGFHSNSIPLHCFAEGRCIHLLRTQCHTVPIYWPINLLIYEPIKYQSSIMNHEIYHHVRSTYSVDLFIHLINQASSMLPIKHLWCTHSLTWDDIINLNATYLIHTPSYNWSIQAIHLLAAYMYMYMYMCIYNIPSCIHINQGHLQTYNPCWYLFLNSHSATKSTSKTLCYDQSIQSVSTAFLLSLRHKTAARLDPSILWGQSTHFSRSLAHCPLLSRGLFSLPPSFYELGKDS